MTAHGRYSNDSNNASRDLIIPISVFQNENRLSEY